MTTPSWLVSWLGCLRRRVPDTSSIPASASGGRPGWIEASKRSSCKVFFLQRSARLYAVGDDLISIYIETSILRQRQIYSFATILGITDCGYEVSRVSALSSWNCRPLGDAPFSKGGYETVASRQTLSVISYGKLTLELCRNMGVAF